MPIPDLHTQETREVAGATTNSRFRFQTNLAIVELCKLYEDSPSDFAVLIEHFDDLTIIEFDEDPGLTFVQIKAKSAGKWTINSLVKCDVKAPSPSSIIGRLYQNASAFTADVKALEFVSNAPYSVKLSSGSKCSSEATDIKGTTFHTEESAKIHNVLEPDFPSPRAPECVDVLRLRKTDLSPSDAQTYVVGRLSQIVEADGGTFAPVSALYKTLFADLLSKASRVDSYSSTDELLAEKGLTKADFSRLLQNSKATGRFERLKDLITEDLRDHGFTTIERARIIATCNKFMANRSRGEFAETQIGDAARKALSEDPAQIENAPSIFDAAETLRSTLEIELKFPTGLLLAGCLVSIAEGLDA